MTFDRESGVYEALRKDLRKFTPLPRPKGTGTASISNAVPSNVDGSFIHLTRNATQSIASAGELISWDTAGLNGFAGFTESVPTTTVTVQQAGYYNVAIQLGWSSFTGGGTVTVQRNGLTVWPPADDPGLWSSTDGQTFEGTAHAISCVFGDTLGVHVNPDDASAQTMASATLAAYLVDRIDNEALYHELVLSHEPVAYWWLDETAGTNAADQLGTYNATYTNSPDLNQTGVMRDGSNSPSVNFDGTKHVLGSDWAALEFTGTANFTLEAWVNTDTVAGNGLIIQKQETSKTNGWEFGRSGDEWFANREGGGVLNEALSSGYNLSTGVNYHVVATFDGTTLTVYSNGVSVATDSTVVSVDSSTATLSIGRDSVTGAANWDGRIDEVAIYDRALSVTEILQHYVAGSRT